MTDRREMNGSVPIGRDTDRGAVARTPLAAGSAGRLGHTTATSMSSYLPLGPGTGLRRASASAAVALSAEDMIAPGRSQPRGRVTQLGGSLLRRMAFAGTGGEISHMPHWNAAIGIVAAHPDAGTLAAPDWNFGGRTKDTMQTDPVRLTAETRFSNMLIIFFSIGVVLTIISLLVVIVSAFSKALVPAFISTGTLAIGAVLLWRTVAQAEKLISKN